MLRVKDRVILSWANRMSLTEIVRTCIFPYTKWSEQRVEQQRSGVIRTNQFYLLEFFKVCWVWFFLYLQNFRLQKFSSLCSWHPQRLPFAAWKIKIYLEPQVQVVLSGAREKWGKLRFFCHIHNAKCNQNYNLGCADCSVTSLTVLSRMSIFPTLNGPRQRIRAVTIQHQPDHFAFIQVDLVPSLLTLKIARWVLFTTKTN